jgi:hypothetical protein
LPLCVIDAVFSIGVKYQSVTNTIKRFCEYFNIELFSARQELSISGFLDLIEGLSIQEMTENIFDNRQRTSARNGILKSEAVVIFHKTLQKFGFEYLKEVNLFADNYKLEQAIKLIPGQRSGISYKYFLMLAGTDYLVKPDRMILRFLDSIGINGISLCECQVLIRDVVEQMNLQGFNLSPRKLDNLIWNYQRSLEAKN